MEDVYTHIPYIRLLLFFLFSSACFQVNMEDEAAAVHALMKANQLSLQMMAAVPAILFGIRV